MGVQASLCLTKSLGIRRLVVELDALLVVQFLDDLLRTVRHIHCEGNSCEDHLANLVQNIKRGLVRFKTSLTSLKPLLHNNACGE
ncbi:hypothetical protein Gotur_010375, partial [Gossypium turneri]